MKGISVLLTEAPDHSLVPSAMSGHNDKSGTGQRDCPDRAVTLISHSKFPEL